MGRQQLPMIGRPAQNRAFETMMVFPDSPEGTCPGHARRGSKRGLVLQPRGALHMRPRPASGEPRRWEALRTARI